MYPDGSPAKVGVSLDAPSVCVRAVRRLSRAFWEEPQKGKSIMKQSMANLVPMRAVPRLDTGTLGYCLSILILTATSGSLLAQSPGHGQVNGRNPVTPSITGGVKTFAAPKGEPDDTPLNYNRAFPLPPGVKPKLPFKPVSAPVILPGALQTGQAFEGIDFLGSSCGCLPPDTDAAVGNNYVVELVNVQLRVFDKTTGNILLDE